MRRMFALIFLVVVSGLADAQPVDLNAHPAVDLSEVVVDLLPADGFKSMGWDYMVNDPLI